jgi:hypothetical protein
VNYLTLYRPDQDTVTYRLAEDYDEAVRLVPAAKAHAGFPLHVGADSPYRAHLIRMDGDVLDVDLSEADGAGYAERESAAADEAARRSAKAQVAAGLGHLDQDALREVLAEALAKLGGEPE